MIRVYVAGPMSKGRMEQNVRAGIDAANQLAQLGFAPYLPHLTHFWGIVYPHDWEFWLALDEAWLQQCHALLRLPGASKGAERETTVAKMRGIPVFKSIATLRRHFDGRN